MNVTLRPELEQFLKSQVSEGRFASVAEALEAGVTRLMTDPQWMELDAEDVQALEESEAQFARGEGLDWKQVSAELRREYLGE